MQATKAMALQNCEIILTAWDGPVNLLLDHPWEGAKEGCLRTGMEIEFAAYLAIGAYRLQSK